MRNNSHCKGIGEHLIMFYFHKLLMKKCRSCLFREPNMLRYMQNRARSKPSMWFERLWPNPDFITVTLSEAKSPKRLIKNKVWAVISARFASKRRERKLQAEFFQVIFWGEEETKTERKRKTELWIIGLGLLLQTSQTYSCMQPSVRSLSAYQFLFFCALCTLMFSYCWWCL